MKNSSASRTPTADLLKGIAALLMIQVHILELFATQDIFNNSLGKVVLFLGGPPVAPVFIVLFGYFIAQSKKSTTKLISRGLKIILLGLLLNIALNFNLIISVYKELFDIDLLPYIFGADILPLAGLSIISIALLKKALDRSIVLVVVFSMIFAFLGTFLLDYITEQLILKYILSFFYGISAWSYFPLFPWLSYALAGFAFFKIKELWKHLLTSPSVNREGRNDSPLSGLIWLMRWFSSPSGRVGGAFFFLLFLTSTINYAITISSDLPVYYHHGLIFFLWVISFLCFYSFFMNEIDKLIGTTIVFKYLKWLGENITVIYVVQWVIIGNIATEIYKTISLPFYLFLWFVGVVTVSSGICYLWIRIKKILIKRPVVNQKIV